MITITALYFTELILFVLLGFLEDFRPLRKRAQGFWIHGAKNFGMRLINIASIYLIFDFLLGWKNGVLEFQGRPIGLLYLIPLAPGVKTALAFLLYDFLMYVFHRASHEVPFLWRFHRVHHSDQDLDLTTLFRFHPGEYLVSFMLFRMLIFPLVGISIQEALLYEVCFKPLDFFHHANVRISGVVDRLMKRWIISPQMHRLHHSTDYEDSNSNYGSFFSIWDRLFGSFNPKVEEPNAYGLNEFDDSASQTISGMLLTPFMNKKK